MDFLTSLIDDTNDNFFVKTNSNDKDQTNTITNTGDKEDC